MSTTNHDVLRPRDHKLCSVCHGNGVLQIPGGISVCHRCGGTCYEFEPAPHRDALAALTAALDAYFETRGYRDDDEAWRVAFNDLMAALSEAKRVLAQTEAA